MSVERGVDQVELPRVAIGFDLAQFRMRLLAVQSGIRIGTSGHHQSVQPTDDLAWVRFSGQLHGQSADGGDALRELAEMDVDLLAFQCILREVRNAADGPSAT